VSVQIGKVTFDRVSYDRAADVLYLHVGDPSVAVDFDESPEGHALRFDSRGHLVGLTIVGARALLQRDGHITVTIPSTRIDVDATTLAPIVAA
jgi:uncharacterized protein YuzE